MEQWLTWNIKEFVKICNECLPPNYTVNRNYLKRVFGDQTTFDLNDFRYVCGQTQADEFLTAKIKARHEQEEIKAEEREAQRQCREEYREDWLEQKEVELGKPYWKWWEAKNPNSRAKRNRRHYLKRRLREGKIAQKEYDEEMANLELKN